MAMNDRAVLVTGASTGIGKACALHFDKLGLRVFAGVRKEADGLALTAEGSKTLEWVRIDVQDVDSITAARAQLTSALGTRGLYGLVNNAGISVNAPLEFVPLSELRRQLEVNVVGQVAVTQAFLPLLRQARGRICNIGSIAGRVASPLFGPYNASKFALEGITDAWRRELRPWGMWMSVVEPGAIATPMWAKSFEAADVLMKGLPPECFHLYGEMIDGVLKICRAIGKRAAPAQKVVDAVEHALFSDSPKARYLVGIDAKVQAGLAGILSDRVLDALIALLGPRITVKPQLGA